MSLSVSFLGTAGPLPPLPAIGLRATTYLPGTIPTWSPRDLTENAPAASVLPNASAPEASRGISQISTKVTGLPSAKTTLPWIGERLVELPPLSPQPAAARARPAASSPGVQIRMVSLVGGRVGVD